MITLKYFENRHWRLIFRQNSTSGGYFSTNNVNKSTENYLFSDLGSIDKLKKKHSNVYTFLLEYPSLKGFNIYSQKISPHALSYPNTDNSFECIKCTWKTNFGPLRVITTQGYGGYLTNFNQNDWWYNIGTYSYGTVLPGPYVSGWIQLTEVYLWLQVSPFCYEKSKCRRGERINVKCMILVYIVS